MNLSLARKTRRHWDGRFTIEPRPFEAALRQAEANASKGIAEAKPAAANLGRNTAQAKNPEVDARRSAEIRQMQIVAQADHDQPRSHAAALQAVVRADEAAVKMPDSNWGMRRSSHPSTGAPALLCFNRVTASKPAIPCGSPSTRHASSMSRFLGPDTQRRLHNGQARREYIS